MAVEQDQVFSANSFSESDVFLLVKILKRQIRCKNSNTS